MIIKIIIKIFHFMIKVFQILINIIIYILCFPFNLLKKLFLAIIKRLKFSISFKISVSYFMLYILIIMVITMSTSVGYFIYTLNEYKNKVVRYHDDIIENNLHDILIDKNIISKNYDDKIDKPNDDIIYNIHDSDSQIENKSMKSESIDELFNNENIINMVIFNKFYENIFELKDNNNQFKYANSVILTIEGIVKNNIYVHSLSFVRNGEHYYVNTYYNVNFLIKDTFYIICIVFVSATFGLLIFIPIVSKTSIKLIKPIKKLTDIARTISVNNINTRLDLKDSQDELKELSETFNEMMDRIEEGYKSQQHFVSDASHELRTPIAVIKGYVDMLDRWGKNDTAILEESIDAIKHESENMQDLIEKLLFIARNDKNTLVFNKEDFFMSDILSEIKKECPMIDDKHIYDVNYYSDANIYADKNRIKQAIRIFIENAIKFTPDGGTITINGYQYQEYYAIKITDTGIGIEKSDLIKIFDRLYRAEQSRNKKIGGHGLGLSIAKIIILGHKGKIKVKSELGKGSQFTILLPRI